MLKVDLSKLYCSNGGLQFGSKKAASKIDFVV
jgi:hypothetical protein